jgi:hypothetical protein
VGERSQKVVGMVYRRPWGRGDLHGLPQVGRVLVIAGARAAGARLRSRKPFEGFGEPIGEMRLRGGVPLCQEFPCVLRTIVLL